MKNLLNVVIRWIFRPAAGSNDGRAGKAWGRLALKARRNENIASQGVTPDRQ
jgi:hypothetical protein